MALHYNTIGNENTADGFFTLFCNISGSYNIAQGSNALYHNISGSENTANGFMALFSNTTGNSNTAYGRGTLDSNTTGTNNTAIGAGAGLKNIIGSGNVFIGYNAGADEKSSNKLYVANSNTANPLIYGDFATKKLTINDVLKITPRAAAPLNPSEGEIYVNSSTHHILCYLNGAWKQIDN